MFGHGHMNMIFFQINVQTVAPHWDAAPIAELIWGGFWYPSTVTNPVRLLICRAYNNPTPLPSCFFITLLFVIFPFNTKHILMQTPTDMSAFCSARKRCCMSRVIFALEGIKWSCSRPQSCEDAFTFRLITVETTGFHFKRSSLFFFTLKRRLIECFHMKGNYLFVS